MGHSNADEIKGRVKEAAGALKDDQEMKQEGKLEQAAGSVKEKVNEAVDKVKNAVSGS